jgi:8-amino-7-oxononanoate synthase
MSRLEDDLAAVLRQLERDSLRRRMDVVESAHGARVTINGRSVLMLSSNNYLGLANHPALKKAAAVALERFGIGAGASRLVAGNLDPIDQLEQRLASFKRTEAALAFGSGYLANLGVMTALAGRGDMIFSDELNHASLIDGCRLSRAGIAVYRHRDADHLKVLLENFRPAGRRLIVTDAVFSMDGDYAPLPEIVDLARRHGAAVIIDEAHAVGVMGPGGAGLAAHLGLADEIDVTVGTLSKAVGAYGAYVAGSRVLTDYLVNRARSFIFTTGLPPAMAAAAVAALDLIAAEPARIDRLAVNANYLRAGLKAAGFNVLGGATPIIPVIIGEPEPTLELAARLLERGVHAVAIRPPTVAPGSARIRVTPTAVHERADLDEAIAAFTAAGREMRLI